MGLVEYVSSDFMSRCNVSKLSPGTADRDLKSGSVSHSGIAKIV